MSTNPKHLVRTRDLDAAQALHVQHPLNPASEIHMTRLSDPTGLTKVGVSLARVPPGKESFVPHAHTMQEEWVYVLEGHGLALVGDVVIDVGPGDFLGFPTDGTVHHLANPGPNDLVFLQGGERSQGDVARFPTLGKLAIAVRDGNVRIVDEADVQTLPESAWLAASDDSAKPR